MPTLGDLIKQHFEKTSSEVMDELRLGDMELTSFDGTTKIKDRKVTLLNLINNLFTSFKGIAMLEGLIVESLWLDNNKLASFDYVAEFKDLDVESLGLEYNEFTTLNGCKGFQDTNVKYLNLACNSIVSLDDIKDLQGSKVETLWLDDNPFGEKAALKGLDGLLLNTTLLIVEGLIDKLPKDDSRQVFDLVLERNAKLKDALKEAGNPTDAHKIFNDYANNINRLKTDFTIALRKTQKSFSMN